MQNVQGLNTSYGWKEIHNIFAGEFNMTYTFFIFSCKWIGFNTNQILQQIFHLMGVAE